MNQERGQRRRWVLSQMSIRSLHPVKQSQLLPQHSHNPFSNNFFWKLLYFTGHLVMFFFFFVKPKKGPMEHLHLSETFSYPSLIGVKLSYLLRVFVITSIGLLGKCGCTKSDDFSEKFQMAFNPASFSENYVVIWNACTWFPEIGTILRGEGGGQLPFGTFPKIHPIW